MDSFEEVGLIKEEYDEIEEASYCVVSGASQVSMHLVLSNQEGEHAAKRRKGLVGAPFNAFHGSMPLELRMRW